jgi:hypothetical protein
VSHREHGCGIVICYDPKINSLIANPFSKINYTIICIGVFILPLPQGFRISSLAKPDYPRLSLSLFTFHPRKPESNALASRLSHQSWLRPVNMGPPLKIMKEELILNLLVKGINICGKVNKMIASSSSLGFLQKIKEFIKL